MRLQIQDRHFHSNEDWRCSPNCDTG